MKRHSKGGGWVGKRSSEYKYGKRRPGRAKFAEKHVGLGRSASGRGISSDRLTKKAALRGGAHLGQAREDGDV